MHSDQPQRALLIVLAHPDDEFAVFPWIEAAVSNSRPVHLVWLTDGGWGGQSVRLREEESGRVLGRIGVRGEAMHFLGAQLGITDGTLHLHTESAFDHLLQLARTLKCDEVMAPAWEGGHQDHDVSHLVASAVATEIKVPAWEFSLYNGHALRGPFFNVLKLIPSMEREPEIIDTRWTQRVRYIAACFTYRSQWKSFLGLLPFYAWRLRRRDAFQRRRVDPLLTSSKPHSGHLLYERRIALRWEEFAAATVQLRHQEVMR